MIKTDQFIDKPSTRTKRKIRPFDVVLRQRGRKCVVKVNMVKRMGVACPPNLGETSTPARAPLVENAMIQDVPEETDQPQDQYNLLPDFRCLSETFARGFMSVESFIHC